MLDDVELVLVVVCVESSEGRVMQDDHNAVCVVDSFVAEQMAKEQYELQGGAHFCYTVSPQ